MSEPRIQVTPEVQKLLEQISRNLKSLASSIDQLLRNVVKTT